MRDHVFILRLEFITSNQFYYVDIQPKQALPKKVLPIWYHPLKVYKSRICAVASYKVQVRA